MTETRKYDVVIIGSGQGGGPLSTAFAAAGRKTALIEREHVGGTCINEGCSPSKTMVASARVAYLAKRAAEYGVETGPISIDMHVVRGRKQHIVDMFREGSTQRIRGGDVDLLMGEARFTGPHAIEVRLSDETAPGLTSHRPNGRTLDISADTIVINTGARPHDPPIDGLDRVPSLNSTTIMDLDIVPEHLVVLGGGYVGLEFGQMFRRFGSRVTIVQQAPQLLTNEDLDVAEQVCAIMCEDNIDVLLETAARRVEPDGEGICLHVRTPDGDREIRGSHLLVAAGRAPNTEALNLEAAGVQKTDKGFIAVNERLETGVPGVYAIGDVAGSPAFTHMSYDDFRILRDNLLHGGKRTTTGRLVPYVVFIDPQLGRVGLTEREAESRGLQYRVARMPMSSVARALETAEPRGMMKVLVDANDDRILGAAILGMEGGEVMAMLEIAMMGGLTRTTLREGIYAHPTLAESLNNLFGMLDG